MVINTAYVERLRPPSAPGLLLWCAASGLQSAFDHNLLSEVSVAGVTANVEVWVGLRALLGLYPGYDLNQAEELRRQAYAVAAALAGNLRLRARFLG